MEIPITQSELWQNLQKDLHEECIFKKENNYQYLAIINNTPVGNYLYLPYGPVFEDEQGMNEAFKSLQVLANQNNAIFLRIEPQSRLFLSHLPENATKTKDLNPQDTWVLDLTPDDKTIISNFSQGTRTRYNNYAKKGLTVESTNNPDEIVHLVRLQNELYKTKKLNAFSEFYLKTELQQPFATLYLVKYQRPADVEEDNGLPQNGQIIAASLFFDYNGTRYYMQSAADGKYKKLPATVALLTKALFDAKEQGMKRFDFWGIAPEGADSSHPWYGFTQFKKSFGGEEVHYSGTYDIVYNKNKYQLYKSLRKINRFLKKS